MPLLGSYGGSSEYAYRGTIDDFPNDFSFTNQTNAIPGQLFTSNQVTITGINNRALVRVSAGASVSVNGGSYVIPTEASPVFIFNNQTLSVRIPSTSGQLTDFNKLYSANVSVGKKTALWEVRTKIVDVDPTPFSFVNRTDGEIGIAYTSNEVTISGLESGFSFPADITSGSGQIIKNGGIGVPSVSVVNGDRIYLRLLAPFEYSEFPTGSGKKTNTTTVKVGAYSTNWSVSSRDVDVFVNPFDFNDINNALTSTVYTEQSVNTLGVVTTITGADQGIPLVTAVSGCQLQVEQPSAGGGFSIRRDFSPSNAIVFNGDRLRVRLTSSPNFSDTRIGIVTVSNFIGKFIVTTRPRPVDTIPDAFTFTDIPSQARGTTVESNEVTLVGMTTFTDEGDASIATGTNGGNAQFQVTRGTSIIKPFSATGSKVRNGDKIKLRITASSEQNITRTATFRVDGIDTSIVITGTTAFRDDIWSVTSASRTCDITPFTLTTSNNVNPNTVQTISFTVDGFQSDCGMVVSTNLGSLSVPGSSLTNNIPVSPGTVVTLSVTSASSFSTARVATVTVSNTSSGVIPNKSYSTTWTVNTVADNRATSVTLSASPTSIVPNQSVTLTWSSINAAIITGFSGEGFNPTTPQGGTATILLTTPGTRNYSITVQGPPSSINPGPVTAPASVTVQNITTPDTFSLNPSSISEQNKSTEVSAVAQSSTNSFVSVSGLTAGVTVNASLSGSATGMSVNNGGRVTSASVKNGDSIRVFMTTSANSDTDVNGTLTIGDRSASFTARTKACTSPTSTKTYAGGSVTVNFKAAKVNNSSTTVNLYTSRSGGGLFTKTKSDTTGGSFFTTTPDTYSIPPGVTQVQVAAVGGGGGASATAGGGSGALAKATIPVTGGDTITITRGSGASFFGADSTISKNGTVLVRAKGGPFSSGKAGFQIESPASGSGTEGGPAGGIPGGSIIGSAGSPSPGSKKGPGGGGGGGVSFSSQPGGIKETAVAGPNASSAGGTSFGTGGANAGGGRGAAGIGAFNNPQGPFPGPGNGAVALYYESVGSSAPVWDSLIQEIVSSIQQKAGRPPSDSEMDTYTTEFISKSALTLEGLRTLIQNASIPFASSFTDSCDGTF
jgi:hypothetical protein